MANVRLIRSHLGDLQVAVGEHFATGARVSNITSLEGEMSAVIVVPLKDVTFEEQSTVVPFQRVGG